MDAIEIETPHGPARVHLDSAAEPAGTLALGHGAGGGVEAVDIATAAEVARAAGFTVALVEQPYRVAGRRSPAPARQLDAAWEAVIAELRERDLVAAPLVVGGRSLGARVACRTAAAVGADAVLCLAFPVHPPGKADDPSKSRQGELDAVELPTLVVQGESDPFGMPTGGTNREVVTVAGNHGLKKDLDAVAAAVGDWLPGIVE
ncbi:MAG TPA: alpha/beta family hydrolase [Solirubrobacterales bacterium]